MTLAPDQRAWLARMADQWGARAEILRQQPGRSAAVRAAAVQDIVDDFRRRLTPTRRPAGHGEIDRVTKRLADAQPRPGPQGLTINGGPVMDAVRHQLTAQLAALRGYGAPVPPRAGAADQTPAEPVPFTAGPQLDLFAFGVVA